MVQKAVHFTPDVLLSAPRRSTGVPNSSGTHVLYTLSTYDFGTHKKEPELRVLGIASKESSQLAHGSDVSDPKWLDDDVFTYLQVESDGSTSVHVASLKASLHESGGGESHYEAGKIPAPASNLRIAQLDESGSSFAFVISAEAAKDRTMFNPEKAKKTRSTGRLYKSLYVRHWDRWETSEKNALWYGKLSKGEDGRFQLSKLSNALTGTQLECPIRPFGGTDNFDVSKNGIVFVSKDPDLNPALNTKCNAYFVSISAWDEAGSEHQRPTQLPSLGGATTNPVFSPDGRSVAYLCMRINGYEADKNQILLLLGTHDSTASEQDPESLCVASTSGWDRSPSSLCFDSSSKKLLLTAEDNGRSGVFAIDATRHYGPSPLALTDSRDVSDMQPLRDGGVFISGSSLIDNSFYAVLDPTKVGDSASGQDRFPPFIKWFNSNSGEGDKFGLKRRQISSIWTPANNTEVNKQVHSWVVKPSSFQSGKRYPVAYLIHGGPQGSWVDGWSTRWNPAVYAEQGYIVIAPNPTGSTGYGQKFTDSIRKNWGGDPYEDIVKVFEWVEENMPEADHTRAVALGASYGGYMMNWIQGHPLGRKFKALVCHDGITSFAGAHLSADELYFPFYDLGGTPWYDPGFDSKDKASAATESHESFRATTFADWRRWDPSEYFDKWETPQLVIHSTKDYRLGIGEGLAAFNVLQARGVESEFLMFPDENHWVLKPENSLAWHKVVLNWINRHVGLPPYTKDDPEDEDFWGGVQSEKEETVMMMGQGKPET